MEHTVPFLGQLRSALTIHSLADLIVTGALLAGGAILHWAASGAGARPAPQGLHRLLVELDRAVRNGMIDEHQKTALIIGINEREGFVLNDPGLIELLASVSPRPRDQRDRRPPSLARLQRANRTLGSTFSDDALARLAAALDDGDG